MTRTHTLPSPPLASTRWAVDRPASSVEFTVRQFWGLSTVHGRFGAFDGELEIGASGAGRAELRIEPASLETGNRRRDRHLRASDYFDCDRHRVIRYVAAAEAAEGGGLELSGQLEAAGRAIALDLVATVERSGDGLELTGAAEIDARELGMSWSPVGNPRTPAVLAVRARLRRVA